MNFPLWMPGGAAFMLELSALVLSPQTQTCQQESIAFCSFPYMCLFPKIIRCVLLSCCLSPIKIILQETVLCASSSRHKNHESVLEGQLTGLPVPEHFIQGCLRRWIIHEGAELEAVCSEWYSNSGTVPLCDHFSKHRLAQLLRIVLDMRLFEVVSESLCSITRVNGKSKIT